MVAYVCHFDTYARLPSGYPRVKKNKRRVAVFFFFLGDRKILRTLGTFTRMCVWPC